ncbi:hypothetical protein Godav_011639 [Gossypium davidsonii]|uniref:HAT C-terminal dimerisation domain-containing protein n=2 Tax=Gossypium TaxID=3633 RepID=A0A7J8RBY8_GOSDV|nr:hypothetical protein [Gossypium davidsonii]MBA0645949.1 hypothetical protein [Gossypium klotzschianum]
MSSSLAGSSNVSDNDHVDSSLHQLNVNRVDLERDYDENILAIPISTVAFESAFSMGKKVITSFRSSLKPKTVQAVNDKNDDNDEDDEDDDASIPF